MFNRKKGQKLVGIFLVFLLVFNFPLIGIFGTGGQILGIPTLLFALFGLWLTMIVALAFIIEKPAKKSGAS